jgi:hypothetical protein
MFLGALNNDEKKAFAGLAQKMIETDGIVVGEEKEALAALKLELGAAEADTREVAELAATFTTRQAKVAALLELIGLGFSDASYSVDESSFVTSVAEAMGIENDEIPQLESWVREHVCLVKRAFNMML